MDSVSLASSITQSRPRASKIVEWAIPSIRAASVALMRSMPPTTSYTLCGMGSPVSIVQVVRIYAERQGLLIQYDHGWSEREERIQEAPQAPNISEAPHRKICSIRL